MNCKYLSTVNGTTIIITGNRYFSRVFPVISFPPFRQCSPRFFNSINYNCNWVLESNEKFSDLKSATTGSRRRSVSSHLYIQLPDHFNNSSSLVLCACFCEFYLVVNRSILFCSSLVSQVFLNKLLLLLILSFTFPKLVENSKKYIGLYILIFIF